MNKDQFIYWLKGFVDAAEASPTQIQWKLIKEKLDEIKDCPDYSSPISDHNTFPIWQQPHYTYPPDINKVTCTTDGIAISGSVSTRSIITDGFVQNVSVTRANPPSTLTYTTGKPVKYKANLPEDK